MRQDTYTFTIEMTGCPDHLLGIIRKLQWLGSLGCSREIGAEEFKIGWWDGDGPDKIRNIYINGIADCLFAELAVAGKRAANEPDPDAGQPEGQA